MRKQYSATPVCPKELTNWHNIEIVDNNETLVNVAKTNLSAIELESFYFDLSIDKAIKNCYLRKGVVERLIRVAEKLPYGYKLHIFDGWRSFAFQEQLYFYYEQKNSSLDEQLEKYVANSAHDNLVPPHTTGGSIDLTIVDNMGVCLPMGTAFDEFTPKSRTNWYEDKQALSEVETAYRDNRRLLFHLMASEGFTNYNEEWWHFDFGNQLWASINGVKAIYGAIDV